MSQEHDVYGVLQRALAIRDDADVIREVEEVFDNIGYVATVIKRNDLPAQARRQDNDWSTQHHITSPFERLQQDSFNHDATLLGRQAVRDSEKERRAGKARASKLKLTLRKRKLTDNGTQSIEKRPATTHNRRSNEHASGEASNIDKRSDPKRPEPNFSDIDLNSDSDDNTQPAATNNNLANGDSEDDEWDGSYAPPLASSSSANDPPDSFEAMTNVTSLPASANDGVEFQSDNEGSQQPSRIRDNGPHMPRATEPEQGPSANVDTQLALPSGVALRNTWKSGGKFLTEVNAICKRDFDGDTKILDDVLSFAAALRSNTGNVEIEPLQKLVNVNRVDKLTSSGSVLSKARDSAFRIRRLSINNSMVDFMQMVERINIAYYRYDYYHNKKGKRKDFDEGVFRHLTATSAQQLVAKICQGSRRYIRIVREFGVGIVLLPTTFNPAKLEAMPEQVFQQVLETVDKELFKARLHKFTKNIIVPKQATDIVDFATRHYYAFESKKDKEGQGSKEGQRRTSKKPGN
ncbi:hypothetical protein BDB00DRAFT_879979 [Zychaea mexicana]|uniref:uncharacterized protein n=1 Tax=Zychaea mexicana TaxID=64656 RepID=UPI0022FE9D36|nr:uncharacterized protein BDB00DRAFT_879979 [Zychaea mexicana]KAI9471411.1 hypothetical protein BDB00DRAFT_879979 [Zychaea mexicana]